jgi:hypothetical protein
VIVLSESEVLLLVAQVMMAEAQSRALGKAPVMENDPRLPLAQQPAMVVYLGTWFGRRPVEVCS